MTDRVEKVVVLRAPIERVWRAVSDSKEFGAWFGAAFDEAFAPGRAMVGRIAPTKVDPAIAKAQEPYAGARIEIAIERVEPMTLLSFRWHPYAVDPNVDYASEPTTLVELRLEPIDGGTRLTIVESGFDRIPLARRAKAFEMNQGGWDAQAKLVEKWVTR